MTPEELKNLWAKQQGSKKEFKDTQLDDSEKYSKIGTTHSMLAGVGSGLIAIPKGLFSLGATLMDLGADTNKAAEVEKYFDDLTEWDEKAEATTAGKITETLINIGVPGGVAFTKGAKLAQTALQSKKLGKYFVADNPNLVKAANKALELNAKGRTAKFIAAATAGGLAESVFIGNVEEVGSFGDLLGGPTQLERDDEYDPERELINRVKFGTEGALFTGVIGGVSHTLKSLAKRSKYLRNSHRKEDQWMDKTASWLRARGIRPEEFFEPEMRQRGLRDADINLAQNTSRELDKNIDSVFGLVRPMFDPLKRSARTGLLDQLNKALTSGTPRTIDLPKGQGVKIEFDLLKSNQWKDIVKTLKDNGATDEVIENIFGNLNVMRTGWGEMFSALGGKLRDSDITNFKSIFGDRFKKYFEYSYEAFQNKSSIPFLSYQPAKDVIRQARAFMMDVAEKNGKPITVGQADDVIERIHKSARPPTQVSEKIDPFFEIEDFFVNKSVLAEENVYKGTARISDFVSKYRMGNGTVVDPKSIMEDILGKHRNPLQTMLSATARMSLVTRRNEFFRDILAQSDEMAKKGIDPKTNKNYEKLFYESAEDARNSGVKDVKEVTVLDPGSKLETGVHNPLLNKYAIPEVVEALQETSTNLLRDTTGGQIYANLILYPKATSQMAKTILSPITHMRNFISAGAFATANGIIPDPAAIKLAYQTLQTPLKGTRKQNAFYRELLELGVTNTNVRQGDYQRLLTDVKFGETMTANSGLRALLKPLSKLKKVSEDLYTAEDDFWKIASWATEHARIGKSFLRAGIKETDLVRNYKGEMVKFGNTTDFMKNDFLKKEAAHIIKHQIPNYAYVPRGIKELRKLPIGNFVSFPAEIIRTSTNIARRALYEINYTLPNGAKPLARIGYQRLVGMGLTTAAVPVAVTKMAQMIYNVTEDEMEALRRYVADWSKNSTLVPIRTEEGDLKYVDFSHANAYDTIVRPFQTILNEVATGREDEDGMMDDFMKGVFEATKELGLPFISESIWTEAALDIISRKGRSREGYEIYNQDDLPGTKTDKIIKHILKSQVPFSWEQLKRLDVAIKPVDVIQDRPGPYDEYGQAFEIGDEALGFVGMRVVNLNPERGLDYKIADYQRSVRNAGRIFKRPTLKGGIVTPEEIVDAYIDANRVLFKARKNMMEDYDAGEILGLSKRQLFAASRRLSKKDVGTIRNGIFRPLHISSDIARAFAENAEELGVENPYRIAAPIIGEIRRILSQAPLSLEMFPELFNPFKGTRETAEEAAATQANINLQTPEVNPANIMPAPGTVDSSLAEIDRRKAMLPASYDELLDRQVRRG